MTETGLDKIYLKLNDIECNKISFHLSNYVWNAVIKREWFAKKTVGSQYGEQSIPFLQTLQKDLEDILKKTK